MFVRIASLACACLLTAGLCLASVRADEPSVGDLALEVEALRGLYYYKLTPAQMDLLKKLAPQTNQKPRPRQGKASKEHVQVLSDLREALVDASNDELIESLEDQLDQLQSADKPKLDDDVDITDAARRQAPEFLRQLKAPQVANYIANVGDDAPDPLDLLVSGFEKTGLPETDWKEQRDEIAHDVGWLIAGLDAKKAGQVQEQAAALLDRARTLRNVGEAELKKEQDELEKSALKIVGDVGPLEVIRHIVEHNLAELLSNPKLLAAIKARS